MRGQGYKIVPVNVLGTNGQRQMLCGVVSLADANVGRIIVNHGDKRIDEKLWVERLQSGSVHEDVAVGDADISHDARSLGSDIQFDF